LISCFSGKKIYFPKSKSKIVIMEHHPNVENFWKPSGKIYNLWKNETLEEFLGENGDDPMICLRCGERTHTLRQCMRYKTELCKYHMNGYCLLTGVGGTNNCLFAHGMSEFRRPRQKKCVKVFIDSTTKKVTLLGCGKYGHTYKQCSLNLEPKTCPAERVDKFDETRPAA
jgi:hypothetical protein